VQSTQRAATAITERDISQALDTHDMPDPDLIIRTSGELRLSNFLMWQAAYAEFCFVKKNWPEFTPEDFKQCLSDYQKRERRFGLTGEEA
jgi:undecaprenyl diphosphate synthase